MTDIPIQSSGPFVMSGKVKFWTLPGKKVFWKGLQSAPGEASPSGFRPELSWTALLKKADPGPGKIFLKPFVILYTAICLILYCKARKRIRPWHGRPAIPALPARGLAVKCECSFLIGIEDDQSSGAEALSHLAELESLARTMGIPARGSLVAKIRKARPSTLIGKGKLEEIAEKAAACHADLLIFDCPLSPSQQRNLEQFLNITVIDREEVILDIFADRASTKEAVLQVALARMEYSLPRLTRAWTHLSRQRGGARGNRGKGETQLESDRRLVLNRIAALKKELKRVRRNRDTQRKKRQGLPVPSLSVVGYTNAGKSSLLNALAGSSVLAEDKLFATLDPASRRVELPGGRHVVLTDTVGFIRKLPHSLVEAFKSTLEEVVLSQALIHVLDLSNPEWPQQRRVTEEVLEELGAGDKPVLMVYNKCDKIGGPEVCKDILHRDSGRQYDHEIFFSAKTGLGIEALEEGMSRILDGELPVCSLLIPPDKWDIPAYLQRNALIISQEYSDKGILIKAALNRKEQNMLKDYIQRHGQKS